LLRWDGYSFNERASHPEEIPRETCTAGENISYKKNIRVSSRGKYSPVLWQEIPSEETFRARNHPVSSTASSSGPFAAGATIGSQITFREAARAGKPREDANRRTSRKRGGSSITSTQLDEASRSLVEHFAYFF